MADQWSISFTVAKSEANLRLDTVITSRHPELSRNTVSRLIREGLVRVDGRIRKPAYKTMAGSHVSGLAAAFKNPAAADGPLVPEPTPLAILFEDEECLVLNKPPGVVVHPAPGHNRQTLANSLIHHCPDLRDVGNTPGRPGIVHRLDKDTSGLLLVAKSEASFNHLSAQFKARSIEKKYLGLVYGQPKNAAGRIDLPIGRHAVDRKKMSSSRYARGRTAETRWRVKARYGRIALIEYTIKTGRTHQIRVHSAAINCPIVGDTVYGMKRPRKFLQNNQKLASVAQAVNRQMLHAWQMRFEHPGTGKSVFIEAPPAPDMDAVIRELNAIYPDQAFK